MEQQSKQGKKVVQNKQMGHKAPPTAAEVKKALGLQGFARKPGTGRGRPYSKNAPADQMFHKPSSR